MIPDRDLRQRDIVPPDRLAQCSATAIGVGAIGRQVALQLAAMGVPTLQLIDPDTVEPANLACQGYFEGDIGRFKVQATADLCHQFNHSLAVHTIQGRFRRRMELGNAVFSCVDSIETRRFIWDALPDGLSFFADGRMAAEVCRVLIACDPASRAHYPTTFFGSSEAYAGSCTAKSTIYCANVAAGLMLAQFARWLRGLPVDADLTINLLSSELSITGGSG